jgi:hypothetical protein
MHLQSWFAVGKEGMHTSTDVSLLDFMLVIFGGAMDARGRSG